jgi:hypothetical protein
MHQVPATDRMKGLQTFHFTGSLPPFFGWSLIDVKHPLGITGLTTLADALSSRFASFISDGIVCTLAAPKAPRVESKMSCSKK